MAPAATNYKIQSQRGVLHWGQGAEAHASNRRFREEWMDKPRIFLGSSGKQAKLLQALTRGLEDVAHVDPWTTSFNPGTTTLDRLVELAHEVDFAAFVFARDDWTSTDPAASPSPETGQDSPRDNVVILDGQDDRQRAELISERLRHWKSMTSG